MPLPRLALILIAALAAAALTVFVGAYVATSFDIAPSTFALTGTVIALGVAAAIRMMGRR